MSLLVFFHYNDAVPPPVFAARFDVLATLTIPDTPTAEIVLAAVSIDLSIPGVPTLEIQLGDDGIPLSVKSTS